MSQTNFLIGRGELLTHDIKAPGGGGSKPEVYTLSEAREHLTPQFDETASELDRLPDLACPHDLGVAKLILNPGYIAKSYFPIALLRSIGLESIGSKGAVITPRKWSKQNLPEPSLTTELFVAGKRSSFRKMSSWVERLIPDTSEAHDLAHIEDFSTYPVEERIRETVAEEVSFFEIGIHLLPDEEPTFIQNAFYEFAASLNVEAFLDLSFQAGNLWFIPVASESAVIPELSKFSFLRVVRPVPKLRGIRPVVRGSGISLSCDLPNEEPLSASPKVAILDGGLPEKHPITPWVNAYRKLDPSANDDSDGLDHGLAVTSAFLFGSITPNGVANRPYAPVDHYRVLDESSNGEDPLELYRTLGFIEQVLLTRQYEFINLSLGPDLPVEDQDVHAWTSVIDELLSDGDTFMTVAGGNNGELDHASGNARIQVPSDCVNAIAVGAASDTEEKTWNRASYSAIGPGRSPGIVKPDLMAFGGDAGGKYFHVLGAQEQPILGPTLGTSFASPYLLRSAVGVKAVLGDELTPLAIKALLVHAAEPRDLDVSHVGWGKVPEDLDEIITCPPGVARIVYKGDLKPGKYLRAQLPLPEGGLNGMIRLKATFCYSCPVDPQDVSAYTRAGLDIVFRPKSHRIKPGKKTAETRSFFSPKKYATEQEQRSDFGKWETVLHGEARMRGSSLDSPVFDIHYNAREFGGKASRPEKIPYALIITIEAAKHSELYNDILQAYANILTPIQPQVSLPVHT